MKKIMVMADTHGNKAAIIRAIQTFKDIDIVIHLGDYAGDARYVKMRTNAEVYAVRGNCDISSSEEPERIITVEGKRILALHGHKQKVKSGLLNLGIYASEKEVDIACFGHSHLPTENYYQNIILYNPGSLGEPRHLKPTVGIITVHEGCIAVKTYVVS